MWSAESTWPLGLLIAGVVLLFVSGITPTDRTTWMLEVFPALLAIPLLVITYKRFH
jgi:putative membrane protein